MDGMNSWIFLAVLFLHVNVCLPRAVKRHSQFLENKDCKEPKNLMKRARRLSDPTSNVIHPSIYSLPIFRPDEMQMPSSPDTKETSNFLMEDRRCPDEANNSSPIHLDRSTCPFYHVITHDIKRVPATMVEVECKCNECRSLAKEGSGEIQSFCQKIYYYTPVLRKVGCHAGEYVYHKVFEPISVGCTCVQTLLNHSRLRRSPKPANGFIAL